MVRIHDRELRLPGVPSNRLGAVQPTAVIVLAAGLGTRMRSATPKVLHEVAGRSLVGHVLAAVDQLNPHHLVVVVGHGRDLVSAHVHQTHPLAVPVVQEQQNGTGHAVRVGLAGLAASGVQLPSGPVVVLAGAAAQYVLLAAEFVAITQVMVYIGAVMVLFLFGTMLTRAELGKAKELNNKNWAIGIPVALLLLGTLTYVLIDSFHADKVVDDPAKAPSVSTQQISDSIFKPYLIPFWALSFVLLAALVGAIVLARKD